VIQPAYAIKAAQLYDNQIGSNNPKTKDVYHTNSESDKPNDQFLGLIVMSY
jgi:hypothetical protein